VISATETQDSEDSDDDDDSSMKKLGPNYKKDFSSIKGVNEPNEPKGNIEASSFRRKSLLKYARRQSRRHTSKSMSNRNKSMNEVELYTLSIILKPWFKI